MPTRSRHAAAAGAGPAPRLAPVHPDAGVAGRRAADHRARRGQLARSTTSAAATSTASRSLWVHRARAPQAGDRRRGARAARQGGALARCSGLASVPSIELADEAGRASRPSGLTRVFYSDSRQHRGRGRAEDGVPVLAADGPAGEAPLRRAAARPTTATPWARSRWAASISSTSVFRGLLFDVERLPTPYAYRWTGAGDCCEACCAAAERLFEEKGASSRRWSSSRWCRARRGCWMQPPGYLRALAELCRKHDVLLDLRRGGDRLRAHRDDVRRGAGGRAARTSSAWRRGSPAATCRWRRRSTTERVYEAFLGESPRSSRPSSTGTRTPGTRWPARRRSRTSSCSRRSATLERMKPDGRGARRRSSQRIAELPHVGEVRQRGLMVGIELVQDRRTKEDYAYGDAHRAPGLPRGAQARDPAAAARERGGADAAAVAHRGRGGLPGRRGPRGDRRGHRGVNARPGLRLFVTATDTGVGKTQVASALLSLLADAGLCPRAVQALRERLHAAVRALPTRWSSRAAARSARSARPDLRRTASARRSLPGSPRRASAWSPTSVLSLAAFRASADRAARRRGRRRPPRAARQSPGRDRPDRGPRASGRAGGARGAGHAQPHRRSRSRLLESRRIPVRAVVLSRSSPARIPRWRTTRPGSPGDTGRP